MSDAKVSIPRSWFITFLVAMVGGQDLIVELRNAAGLGRPEVRQLETATETVDERLSAVESRLNDSALWKMQLNAIGETCKSNFQLALHEWDQMVPPPPPPPTPPPEIADG